MVALDKRLPYGEKDRKGSFLTTKVEVGGSDTGQDLITRFFNALVHEIDRHCGSI